MKNMFEKECNYKVLFCRTIFERRLNPKRAGLFGPISQPGGGGFCPPQDLGNRLTNIKCVVLVESYDPPKSIGTKKSTNIPCMTLQWRHVKNTKITKYRQNHGFSLFFQAKLHFLAMMCVKVCLHMFLLQIVGQFFVGPSALLRNAAS